jgi:CheY-like chemotaxis protein
MEAMLEAISRDRVAVFDDDIQFIRLVERVLKGVNIDIEPVTTPDVEEAVRVVSCGGCRAALIDLYMYGDASGLQMVEELRQNPQTADLPLIVTSAAHRELGRRVGFLLEHHCSVLLKPFSIDDLLSRIGVSSTPGAGPITATTAAARPFGAG